MAKKKPKWRITVYACDSPVMVNRTRRFTERSCELREAIEYASWSMWASLKGKVGWLKADITDMDGVHHATVTVAMHKAFHD